MTRGVAGFRKAWDVDAADTPLWRELRAALFLGIGLPRSRRRDRGSYARRTCSRRWPSDLDPDDYGAIISKEVLVKAGPYADSRNAADAVLRHRSRNRLGGRRQDPGDKQRWVKVKVKSGEGYVPDEQIRSPIEHSACFVKTEGGWRMTAFAPAGGPQ